MSAKYTRSLRYFLNEFLKRYNEKERVTCNYGCWEGGPGYYGFSGCNHSLHEDVHYGTYCPLDCPEYQRRSDEEIIDLFVEFYKEFQIKGEEDD